MARTGVSENQQANADNQAQKTQTFNTSQDSIAAGKAGLAKLMSGQNIAANPFTNYRLGTSLVRYAANKEQFLSTLRGQDFIKKYPSSCVNRI
jgi:hypothetical protein